MEWRGEEKGEESHKAFVCRKRKNSVWIRQSRCEDQLKEGFPNEPGFISQTKGASERGRQAFAVSILRSESHLAFPAPFTQEYYLHFIFDFSLLLQSSKSRTLSKFVDVQILSSGHGLPYQPTFQCLLAFSAGLLQRLLT